MPCLPGCGGTAYILFRLELLRRRLPVSLDSINAHLPCTMALLYETVPTFEDTWIECLGDLIHYHMAIKDDDI